MEEVLVYSQRVLPLLVHQPKCKAQTRPVVIRQHFFSLHLNSTSLSTITILKVESVALFIVAHEHNTHICSLSWLNTMRSILSSIFFSLGTPWSIEKRSRDPQIFIFFNLFFILFYFIYFHVFFPRFFKEKKFLTYFILSYYHICKE